MGIDEINHAGNNRKFVKKVNIWKHSGNITTREITKYEQLKKNITLFVLIIFFVNI
jgi:hypothetical protein